MFTHNSCVRLGARLFDQKLFSEEISQGFRFSPDARRRTQRPVAVNFFISVNFWFSFVLNSLAYLTIPRNNGKIKINCNIYIYL